MSTEDAPFSCTQPTYYWVHARGDRGHTGRPDHCRTSQLANEIGYFQRVFAEKSYPLCILSRISLIWLDSFDKSRNRIMTGMV